MGMFDALFSKKKTQPTAIEPDESGGYEDEGNRSTEVKEPSFADNFRYGSQGGTQGSLPGSWGEGLGRINKMNQDEAAGKPQKQQFGGLLKLLGQ